ncbi:MULTISPECIES: Cof-type HAD-IIB family hydrolase [Streptococcus]|uniref:Cof-type HAD-IIB family hydrolase n=1 Tax=Streptococcus caledonicus TaxID=2614158 RepID=A0ABW0UGF9_9STRE|nr:Cof-type HAD-IIB family hydrolase [Streptococcus sp. S784/96/1]
MAVKAVFFDIDGTLVNDMKKVQRSTQKAIAEMKKQGILVGLATGRGPGFVAPFMENLGLDFAVAYNGQYIITRDKILYQNQLPKSLVYKAIKFASNHRMEISLGSADGLLGSNIINMGTSPVGQVLSRIVPKKWTKSVERSFKHLVRRVKPQNSQYLLTMMRQPVYQIVLITTKTQLLKDEFPTATVTRSSPYSADVISQGQSKVKGIARVGEVFGFDLSEVMAFGDSDNDMEMLSGVGVAVAMGNANEELKAVAHYVTETNNKDGIAKALAHFGLIHVEQEKVFGSRDDNFNRVKDFHQLMDGETCEMPRVYDLEEAGHRSGFKVEEIIEFLYATSGGNPDLFKKAVEDLHQAVDKAVQKVEAKGEPVDNPLVGQVDALTYLLYFTYGSFVLMGVDPKPFFDTVHEANMGKIFPDGKAHFDPITHKILKPDDWEKRFAPEPAIKRELDRQIQKAKMKQRKKEIR